LLNLLFQALLPGTTVNVSVLDWNALAQSNVNLNALVTQLGTNLGLSDTSQILNTNITLAQLQLALVQVAQAGGNAAAVNALNALPLSVPGLTGTIKLGDFLNVAQGSQGVALGSRLSLLQLVNSSAQSAALNGSNTVSISDAGISVPGVVSTAVTLTVIEPPKMYIGPKGGPTPPLSTGQVSLKVTPKLDLDVTISGLVGAKVNNDLPVAITVAGAKGYIKDINCGTPKAMTVNVDPSAFSGSATTSTPLRLSAVVLAVRVPLLDIGTTSVVPSTDAPAQDVTFSYPSEFFPTGTSKHVGSQPIGLQALTTFTAGTTTVLGVLPLPTATVVATVFDALSPVLGNVDSSIVTPLLTALGIDIGGADVTALTDALKCDTPGLVR